MLLTLPVQATAENSSTVALVMKALTNPFFLTMEEGARNFAKEEGISLEVFGVDRETDVSRQIGIMENLISRRYGAIVLAPADSKKLVPICKKALERGIKVINIDNPLHQPTMDQLGISIPFIGPDNFSGGEQLGRYVMDKLQGRGRLLIIEGIPGVENAEKRKNGFMSAVANSSEIEVVASVSANWHTDEAFSAVTSLLAHHPDIDAIFCANDAMALGARQAIDQLGIDRHILVVGYDNIESVRTEIRSGHIDATIEQHPELMGAYGVEAAVALLNGDEVASFRPIPLDLITHETFDKKIAFSVSTMRNSFFYAMTQSAISTAKLFGMEIIVLDADNGDAQQLLDITNALTQETDLLIINPTNTESILPGIELAREKKTPVITIDRKATTEHILSHIEADHTAGGRLAASFMANHLKGEVRIMEVEGIPGTSAAHERGAGFNEELGNHPRLKIIHREVANFDRKEAKMVMERLLKNGTTLDGIFAHNDSMILGVIDAYREAGVTLPKILIGFDAIPEAKRLIKAGELTATIAQDPIIIGKLAVQAAARHFRGEQLPATISVELKLISQ